MGFEYKLTDHEIEIFKTVREKVRQDVVEGRHAYICLTYSQVMQGDFDRVDPVTLAINQALGGSDSTVGCWLDKQNLLTAKYEGEDDFRRSDLMRLIWLDQIVDTGIISEPQVPYSLRVEDIELLKRAREVLEALGPDQVEEDRRLVWLCPILSNLDADSRCVEFREAVGRASGSYLTLVGFIYKHHDLTRTESCPIRSMRRELRLCWIDRMLYTGFVY